MDHPQRVQLSIAGFLLLVACVALNIWLFRVGILAGIVGLNITKHLVIAWLCKALGVDRRHAATPAIPRPATEGAAAP